MLFLACERDDSIKEDEDKISIIGTWKFRESTEAVVRNDTTFNSFAKAKVSFYPPYSFTFNQDGTGMLDGESFTYILKNDSLYITANNKTVNYILDSGNDDELRLKLDKSGLNSYSGSNIDIFSKISFLGTYKNLNKIIEENSPAGVYKVCSILTTRNDGWQSLTKFSYNEEQVVSNKHIYYNWGTSNQSLKKLNYSFDHKLFQVKVNYESVDVWFNEYFSLNQDFSVAEHHRGSIGYSKNQYWDIFKYDNSARISQVVENMYGPAVLNKDYEKQHYNYQQDITKVFYQRRDVYQYGSNFTDSQLLSEYIYSKTVPKESINYIYNFGVVNNHLEKHVIYSNGTASPLESMKYSYELDNLGRIKTKTVSNLEGKVLEIQDYNYNCEAL